jgi:hypothetical protein
VVQVVLVPVVLLNMRLHAVAVPVVRRRPPGAVRLVAVALQHAPVVAAIRLVDAPVVVGPVTVVVLRLRVALKLREVAVQFVAGGEVRLVAPIGAQPAPELPHVQPVVPGRRPPRQLVVGDGVGEL